MVPIGDGGAGGVRRKKISKSGEVTSFNGTHTQSTSKHMLTAGLANAPSHTLSHSRAPALQTPRRLFVFQETEKVPKSLLSLFLSLSFHSLAYSQVMYNLDVDMASPIFSVSADGERTGHV